VEPLHHQIAYLDLWTDLEVATALGKRSARAAARLREQGEWSYLPGRPPLTPRSELEAYVKRNTIRKETQRKAREPRYATLNEWARAIYISAQKGKRSGSCLPLYVRPWPKKGDTDAD
jgi:hypothetical protein